MTREAPISILFTDLDGTLLNSERNVSTSNLSCLHHLGRRGIVRVIATGRSHYSFRKVIAPSFPADFLIFSSGAGIIDLNSNTLLYSTNLESKDITIITRYLQKQQIDFMVHQPVPENHHFVYCRNNTANHDFNNRVEVYKSFASDYQNSAVFPQRAAQIIAILPENTERLHSVVSSLNNYQVTRTTSPLDHRSIWLEIQPANIHKGSAAAWLCNHLDLDPAGSLGIGNDYNDLDLLDFTPRSYLLNNAPLALHQLHRLSLSHDHDGFCHAVKDAMGIP